MNLFFDIETIPTQRQEFIDAIADSVTPPGNISKAETIAKWEEEKKPALVEEAYRKTSLNGMYAEIISMAWAIDDNEPKGIYRTLEQSEKELLEQFFSILGKELKPEPGNFRRPTWTGHNIIDFDLRLLWQRCLVNQVQPTIKIPYDSKPWGDEVFDTMKQWCGFGQRISQDKLGKALFLPGKGDMDGSKVWDYIQAGKYTEVFEYNKQDIIDVRGIYRYMTFQAKV